MNDQIKAIKSIIQELRIQATEQNIMLLAEVMIRLNKMEEDLDVRVENVQVVPQMEAQADAQGEVTEDV